MIVPRSVDLGGFAVRRSLPHAKRRMVGPFVFDHFGPAEFRDGQGIDVRRIRISGSRDRELFVRRRGHPPRQPRQRPCRSRPAR